MFPTLSSLITFLTGIDVPLPIQTFGFMVAVSFWLSYLAFKKEFIRKEKLGYIQPFEQRIQPWRPLAVAIGWALGGFILGYKIVFAAMHYRQLAALPSSLLFSWQGNIAGGLIGAVVFFVLARLQTKDDATTNRTILVHPYQHTDRLLLWCASIGFIGAILFAKLENLGLLFTDPAAFFTTLNGLAFYGGLIFGAGIYFYRTKKMGVRFLTAADIGSPGMMLAYGIGRMGCHLSGDGDWGKINTAPKPSWLGWAPDWLWSFDYPHNVIHEGRYIEGCGEAYCNVLTAPVYPSSLYESFVCLPIFAMLWVLRNRIKTPGKMFFIFLTCNGLERLLAEFIKINPRYCLGGLCLTQAQFIAVMFIIGGLAGLTWLSIRPPGLVDNS